MPNPEHLRRCGVCGFAHIDHVRGAVPEGCCPQFVLVDEYRPPRGALGRHVQRGSTLDRIRKAARDCGYAVAVHGSETRDLDLIAVPWTDDALGNHRLVDVLCEEVPLVAGDGPVGKPHGRIGWVLHGVAGYEYVDLSITPRGR